MLRTYKPPGSDAASDNRRNHERRGDEPDTLIRDAARLLEAAGVVRSASWLSRTVRAFRSSVVDGMPFGIYLAARLQLNQVQRRRLAERADLRYLLTYADPTGETAVRNVMRERGF